MSHWRKSMDNDSEYVGSWDLDGDTTVTIEKVASEKVKTDKGEKRKIVLYFEKRKKGMVCNVTNAKTIARLYGNEVEAWVGQTITLYATTTTVAGDVVDCIRVRPVVKATA